MKKVIILLYLLLTIGTLHSLEGEFGISLGVLGYSFDFYKNYPDNMYGYGRIGSFTYQSAFGLGVTISPFVFYYNDNDNSSLFFANITIDYNALHKISSRFILGPFASINALEYGQPTSFDFRSGFKFSLLGIFYDDSIFHNELFIIELGYKYNKIDKHSFFATIGIDMAFVFYFFGAATMPNHRIDPDNPNPERKY